MRSDKQTIRMKEKAATYNK